MPDGQKFDTGKDRIELISPEFIFAIAKVLTHGAKKYAARNWEKGIVYSRVFGAIMRHLWKFWLGHKFDPESGMDNLEHLAEAATELMFLYTFEARCMKELDDRPKIATKLNVPQFGEILQQYDPRRHDLGQGHEGS